MTTRNMFRGVLQNRAIDGHRAPAWATAVTRSNGNWYFEETPHQRPLDRFQLAGSGATRQYDHRTVKGYDYYYDLPALAQVAPAVPPAPAPVKLPPAVSVVVTQAYVDHRENRDSYFKRGDEVHISERQRQYYVVRDGKNLGGSKADGSPQEHGSCDPDWVAQFLNNGGFVPLDEALPAAPESGLYLSSTGRRKLRVVLNRPQRDVFPNDEGNVQFKIDNVYSTVRLSAETARDLASDLYRMARQLEKDNK